MSRLSFNKKEGDFDKIDQQHLSNCWWFLKVFRPEESKDVLWNATNMTAQQRAAIIDIALDYRAKIKIVYVDCSVPEAIKRNKQRTEYEQVRESVIEKYSRKMEIPDLSECHVLEVVKSL